MEHFVAALAHDLQQPLCAVKGNVEVVRDYYSEQLPGPAAEMLEAAIRMSARMAQMIDGLSAYACAGSSRVTRAPLDLDVVLAAACADLRVAVEESNAVVSYRDLPMVLGDEISLVQLFQNLLANAVKFRGPEPPRIDVSAELRGRFCTIAVRDNGVGVAEEDRERIFEPFARAPSSAAVPGSGIGLATCKRIVENHSGAIWVESAAARGSTFFVRLSAAPRTRGKTPAPPTTSASSR